MAHIVNRIRFKMVKNILVEVSLCDSLFQYTSYRKQFDTLLCRELIFLQDFLSATKHLSRWLGGLTSPVGKRGVACSILDGDIYFHFEFFAFFPFITDRLINHTINIHIYYCSRALRPQNV